MLYFALSLNMTHSVAVFGVWYIGFALKRLEHFKVLFNQSKGVLATLGSFRRCAPLAIM